MDDGIAHDCLFVGNVAGKYGGGLKSGFAYNCVCINNTASYGGGMAHCHGAYNSIIYYNQADEEENLYYSSSFFSCSPDVTHGVRGCITNAPLFVDLSSGDYRLLPVSPCIDAGTNDFVTSLTDLYGNPRITDGDQDGTATVDMGAYEFSIIEVITDIKPGSDRNPINLGSKGRLSVALLTTEDFDAMTVDPNSVRLAGAAPVHTALEDIDADGDKDLVLHFPTQELQLTNESTEAYLIGQTHDGLLLMGVDSVRIVPKNK
jgi:hypothetical protein